jgi:S1-C subfamily serine protease
VLGFRARDADGAPRAGRSATSPHSSAAPISAARRRARAAVLLAALLGGAALSSGSAGAQTASIGSGFLVRPDGWILTVAQVVVGARQIAVSCRSVPP